MAQVVTLPIPSQILRRPVVEQAVGLSRPTIYRLIKRGLFPKQISLGGTNAVGWLASDIEKWISDSVAASKGVQ